MINTAYIERLQATFRSRLAGLARRSRAPVRLEEKLEAGMFLVGTCYNFCWEHGSMRREREGNDPPGGTVEYRGTTYYFCGPGCRMDFQEDQEGYLSGRKKEAM